MAEEDDSISAGKTGDAAALGLAMHSVAAEDARAYLREQTDLARLQKQNLIEQNAFELSHLRWRRFNDQMKGAIQIMVVAVGAVIVACIGVAIWDASQADGTVVEAFSVPPSFAGDGIGGDGIANDMTNKLSAIRDVAEGNSLSRSRGVRRDSATDIKVEIPDTGISLGEAARYLRGWLGNERRVSGNLRVAGDNKIALTVTVDGQTKTLTGTRGDLDQVEQKAAEWAFTTVDPQNMVLYLWAERRSDEAFAALANFAGRPSDTELERSDAYSLWANMTRTVSGDISRSQALAKVSTAIDSRTVAPHMELLTDARYLGHDEEMLRQARIIPTKRIEDETPEFQKVGFGYAQELGRFSLEAGLGDFTRAAQETCAILCSAAGARSRHAEYFARLHDPEKAQELLQEARVMDSAPDVQTERARYFEAMATSDWRSALAAAHDYEAAERFTPPGEAPTPSLNDTLVKTQVDPLLAIALARSGDINAARATIAATPLDCYDCLRARGMIEGLVKNWTGAASWFARATAAGPSIPFAFADWGAMLMAKGDLDGAIAKLEVANRKGPHFADPMELLGEALIAKNRADLALAKFEEAGKYAPNWKRLHRKWGEALSYLGRKDEAAKQFAVAGVLQ